MFSKVPDFTYHETRHFRLTTIRYLKKSQIIFGQTWKFGSQCSCLTFANLRHQNALLTHLFFICLLSCCICITTFSIFFWLSLKRAYILIRLASIYFSNPNVLTCIFMIFRYVSMYADMYHVSKYSMTFFRKTNSCTTLRNVAKCVLNTFLYSLIDTQNIHVIKKEILLQLVITF